MMTWWGWVLLGAILLGLELTLIDAQFYLVFVGGAAVIVGFADRAFGGFAPEVQWLAFGALSVAGVVGFRRTVYEKIRGEPTVARETGPVGHEFALPEALEPGASCQAEFRGSHWTITNGSDQSLGADARVRVVRIEGLSLIVGPV
jgi:membrane protein implicated in regulation of membrane protease activity